MAGLARVNYRHTLLLNLTTTMALDAALKLSIEQLISALNKKIFMECSNVQLMAAPTSRALAAALTAEVRPGDMKENQRVLTK